jgi:glycosyltransferase involved in cell wall biosynthesis
MKRVSIGSIQAVWAALKTRPVIVHCHDPELVWAIPLMRLMGKKVIYDAHEDLPNQVRSKTYILPLLRPIIIVIAHLIVFLARISSSYIIAATETIAQSFPSRKVTVIHNYPPLRVEERGATPIEFRPNAVVYVGGISRNRGSEVMVDMVTETNFPHHWKLELAGSIAPDERDALSRRSGWAKVTYHGQLSSDNTRELLLTAKVGIVVLRDTPAYRQALATKMFEYFAAGLPVIASDFPLWRSIIEKHDCGTLVDPASSSAVAGAVRRYANDEALLIRQSRNARQLAVDSLNWASEGEALVSVYQRIH